MLLIISNCSLFSPSEADNPDDIGDLDPFNWKKIPAIYDASIFQFSYYTEILHEDFAYENFSQTHFRNDFTSRLNSIVNNYDSIVVTWNKIDSLPDPSFENVTEVELKVRSYLLTAWLDNSASTYTGLANFTLKQDEDNDNWLIKKWKDTNDSTGVSFFNPSF